MIVYLGNQVCYMIKVNYVKQERASINYIYLYFHFSPPPIIIIHFHYCMVNGLLVHTLFEITE